MMLQKTDTRIAPWHIVRSDDKRTARLNTIAHLLSVIPHKKLPQKKVKLPKRSSKGAYDDAKSIARRRFVRERDRGGKRQRGQPCRRALERDGSSLGYRGMLTAAVN